VSTLPPVKRVALAVVAVVALLGLAAVLCQQQPPEKPEVIDVGEFNTEWALLTVTSSASFFPNGGAFAYSSTSAMLGLDTSNGANAFSAPSITAGTSAMAGPPIYIEAKVPDGCSEVVIIEIFHVERKPQNATVHATDGIECGTPPCPGVNDGAGNHHVNRWAPIGSSAPPWLPGSTPGTPGGAARGSNLPPKVRLPYRVVFEACAYCSAKPGDRWYQQYLGCEDWYFDPQLTPPWGGYSKHAEPSQPFKWTMDRWTLDHGAF